MLFTPLTQSFPLSRVRHAMGPLFLGVVAITLSACPGPNEMGMNPMADGGTADASDGSAADAADAQSPLTYTGPTEFLDFEPLGQLTLTFSAPLNPARVDALRFELRADIPTTSLPSHQITATVDPLRPSTVRLSFVPSLRRGTGYRLQLLAGAEGVASTAGTPLSTATELSIQTRALQRAGTASAPIAAEDVNDSSVLGQAVVTDSQAQTHIAWTQGGNVYARMTGNAPGSEVALSAPFLLSNSLQAVEGESNPILLAANDGKVFAFFLARESTPDSIRVYSSIYEPGSGWRRVPEAISGRTFGIRGLKAVIDSRNQITAVWAQPYAEGGLTGYHVFSNRRSSAWNPVAERIDFRNEGINLQPQMNTVMLAVSQQGDVFATWSQVMGTGAPTTIWANYRSAASAWGTAAMIDTSTGTASRPENKEDSWIGFTSEGRALFAYRVATTLDPGVTLTNSIRVNRWTRPASGDWSIGLTATTGISVGEYVSRSLVALQRIRGLISNDGTIQLFVRAFSAAGSSNLQRAVIDARTLEINQRLAVYDSAVEDFSTVQGTEGYGLVLKFPTSYPRALVGLYVPLSSEINPRPGISLDDRTSGNFSIEPEAVAAHWDPRTGILSILWTRVDSHDLGQLHLEILR